MMLYDCRRDYEFDMALDELMREERALLALAEQHSQMVNIGNPQKLIGAQ